MKKLIKKIFKEIKPTIELLAALILGVLVIPFGFIWAFYKPFYDNYINKRNFIDSVIWFYKYWINVVLQLLKVSSYLFERLIQVFRLMFFELMFWKGFKLLEHSLAISIDIYGNVTSGELIEDLITTAEDTYFGHGSYTISAATGHLELNRLLDEEGIWFTNALSFCFEENHSINAYNFEVNG